MGKIILKNISTEKSISILSHGGARLTLLPEETAEIAVDSVKDTAPLSYYSAFYAQYADQLSCTIEGLSDTAGGMTETEADAKYAAKSVEAAVATLQGTTSALDTRVQALENA